mmetsp:Transcript_41512/g.163358  ORF Transcript_41512/g.163358 Transcript_41512/m.163358 type:complete len:242 (+) Transcript_41512:317-1042(+)
MMEIAVSGVAIFLVLSVGLVLALFSYVGAFDKPQIQFGKTDFQCLPIWYKCHVGPYANVSPCTQSLLEEFKLRSGARRCVRLVFVYYDNPYKVQDTYGTDALCRWIVGVAMGNKETDQLPPDEKKSLETELAENGYKPFTLKGTEVVRAVFPITLNRFVHFLNRTIRVQMVFPDVKKALERRGLEWASCVLEIYHDGISETMVSTDVKHGLKWVVEEAHELEPSKVFAALQSELAQEARVQ